MDRRSILESVFAAIALHNSTRIGSAQTGKQPVIVPAGEDRFQEKLTVAPCMLSGKDTNGAMSIFGPSTRTGPPGSVLRGVPLHVHHDQDEWWYILTGEYLFQIGNRKIRAKAGDAVFGPRGVPHSPLRLSQSSSSITLFQPAGTMEEFFHEVAKLRPGTGQDVAVETMGELFRAHGMEIVGPAVQLL
jgi:mannose-6-phosphate isomerase-like protein (cupin superfamily)